MVLRRCHTCAAHSLTTATAAGVVTARAPTALTAAATAAAALLVPALALALASKPACALCSRGCAGATLGPFRCIPHQAVGPQRAHLQHIVRVTAACSTAVTAARTASGVGTAAALLCAWCTVDHLPSRA